jgi:hypothetical protein
LLGISDATDDLVCELSGGSEEVGAQAVNSDKMTAKQSDTWLTCERAQSLIFKIFTWVVDF